MLCIDEFSCLDALLLKAEIFTINSRVSDLLDIMVDIIGDICLLRKILQIFKLFFFCNLAGPN